MPGIEGKRLREWRRARGWDVPQLARQLRRAAKEPVAAHDGLVRMIRSWERGTHMLSERYELLYRSLGFGGAAAPALDALFSQLVAYLADTRPAERFQIALRTLRDTDNLFGPRDVIPLAMRQLAVMRDLSAALRGRDNRELMLPQIQFADLLGWLYQDTCDFDAALHWLDRALEWARVLGDQDCIAFILARKSQPDRRRGRHLCRAWARARRRRGDHRPPVRQGAGLAARHRRQSRSWNRNWNWDPVGQVPRLGLHRRVPGAEPQRAR